jgi:hypothetical protein
MRPPGGHTPGDWAHRAKPKSRGKAAPRMAVLMMDIFSPRRKAEKIAAPGRAKIHNRIFTIRRRQAEIKGKRGKFGKKLSWRIP